MRKECGDPAGRDERDANSYLPFTGRLDLKQAVSARVADRSGVTYDPEAEIVVTATQGDALLDVLLALTDPGDEVILTDFTYAGMLNRVHLVGAVPRDWQFCCSGTFLTVEDRRGVQLHGGVRTVAWQPLRHSRAGTPG